MLIYWLSHTYTATPRANIKTKQTTQRNTLRGSTDKSNWNFKICAYNLQEFRGENPEKWKKKKKIKCQTM